MRRKILLSCLLIMSIVASSFTGCANDGLRNGENAQTKEAPKKREIFWQEQKFPEVSDVTEGNPVYITGYYEDLVKEPDFTYEWGYQMAFGVSEEKLCFVNVYSEEKTRYFLDIFDLNTKDRSQRELHFDGLEIPGFSPCHCEIMNGGNMVFLGEAYNQDYTEVTNYYAVYMNAQGECLKTLDVYAALTEFGLKLDPQIRLQSLICDGEGYLYISDPESLRVGIIDDTGTLIDTMELEGTYDGGVVCSMKSPEGIPIFEAANMRERKNTLFWYDTEKKALRVLADTKYDAVYAYGRSFNQFGEIYYIRYNKIVCWNTASGKQERIFDCKSNGMGENEFYLRCVNNAAGELFLLDTGGDTVCLYEFSDKPAEKESSIRIVDICSWNTEDISAGAATFSRKNPSCHIEFESDTGSNMSELEAYRDRILAEVMSGKGPEILIVDGDDLRLLNEKGALADISGILPKETEEQIFKSVLEAGTIDGKLVGLASGINMSFFLVSKSMWTKDSWTLEEFVDLVEEKEGEIDFAVEGDLYLNTPQFIMKYLTLMDLKNSPFIDWEKGESYFDSGLFKKTLEIAKRYGVTPEKSAGSISEYEEEQKRIKESMDSGRAVAFVKNHVNGFKGFTDTMAFLGEDYFCVGFPTNGKSGNYLNCGGYLVVNKTAADMDAIYKFIQYLYNEENQRKGGADTIRKDVLKNAVIPHEVDLPQGGNMNNSKSWNWAFDAGGNTYYLLDSKQDGSSYLEDYLEFIDACVPAPVGTQEIEDIISEETEGYFSGEKDVDRTVEVIQRRVQLYLDEHK